MSDFRPSSLLRPGEFCLETPRLVLRTMRADDLDALLTIFGDPRVMAAFSSSPFTRKQMQGWLQRNLEHQAEHGFGLFAIIIKSHGTLIGNCGLEMMEIDGATCAELGYDIRSDYWNRGIATEAATTVRDYAFQTLNLPRLISLIRVGNQASKRVAEKIGMHHSTDYAGDNRQYWRYELAQQRGEASSRPVH